MSADPGQIVVKDANTGEPVSISTSIFPPWMKPDLWFDNPQWQHSLFLDRSEVQAYLNERLGKPKIPRTLARKIALYVETYAKHISMMSWLFMPPTERPGYEADMKPFLEKLEGMRRSCQSGDDVADMIHLCLDHAIDPL